MPLPTRRIPEPIKLNREAWLGTLTEKLRTHFADCGYPLKAKTHVSVGFPSVRATSRTKRRIGECWAHGQSADGCGHIFISPMVGDAAEVAHVLVHELIHDTIGCDKGHKRPFQTAMTKLGLEGKATATHAGEKLVAYLASLTEALGPYPHPVLSYSGKEKKQSTRLIKAACAECGYTVRVTRKWLDIGLPGCPSHGAMAVDGETDTNGD